MFGLDGGQRRNETGMHCRWFSENCGRFNEDTLSFYKLTSVVTF